MLRKIWAVVRSDLYMALSDRTVILLMFVTPLTLATIIGLVFSSFAGGGGGISGIRVALVNHDRPADISGEPVALGDIFEQVLVPPAGVTDEERAQNELWRLMDTALVADEDAARRGVEEGDYEAAVIIPEDFTQKLAPLQGADRVQPVTLEVYSSPASPILASVARSVIDSIAVRVAAGSVSVSATLSALGERAASDPAFGRELGAALTGGDFQPDLSTLAATEEIVTINRQTGAGAQVEFNPFVSIGAGQAIFFMMFMAMAGANEVRREKQNGTLDRLLATPTPGAAVLLAKLLSTMVVCAVQVLILLAAFTLISGIVSGQFRLIFGTNLLGLGAAILAVALAASGLGTLVTAFVKSPEQGDVIGSTISLAMGLFGGAFFNVAAFGPLSAASRLTINYWGVNAFTRLSQGSNDIALNLLVLFLIGAVTYVVGFTVFSRRLGV